MTSSHLTASATTLVHIRPHSDVQGVRPSPWELQRNTSQSITQSTKPAKPKPQITAVAISVVKTIRFKSLTQMKCLFYLRILFTRVDIVVHCSGQPIAFLFQVFKVLPKASLSAIQTIKNCSLIKMCYRNQVFKNNGTSEKGFALEQNHHNARVSDLTLGLEVIICEIKGHSQSRISCQSDVLDCMLLYSPCLSVALATRVGKTLLLSPMRKDLVLIQCCRKKI